MAERAGGERRHCWSIRRPAGETTAQPWPEEPVRDAWTEAPARPLRLLPHPEPIEAVAPIPDDPPLLFRWRRVLHRVARADGPERLAPEWWRLVRKRAQRAASRDHADSPPDVLEARDYYRVEDKDGRRFWLYRDGLYRPTIPPRWYLHGMFA